MSDSGRAGVRVKGAVSLARAGAICASLFFALVFVSLWPADLWLTLPPAAISLLAFVRSLSIEVRVSSNGVLVRSWLKTYRFSGDDIAYIGVGNYDGMWIRGHSAFGLWSVYVEVRGPQGRERVALDVTMSGRRRALRTVHELKEVLARTSESL